MSESSLKDLNIGGSVDYGYENNPLTPAVLLNRMLTLRESMPPRARRVRISIRRPL
jgi:hypothetical protein